MLGLKRGTVQLMEHQESWHDSAAAAVFTLKEILSTTAIDIQHVGSTAICGIHAKPIIDIAVGVSSTQDVIPYTDILAQNGVIYRKQDVAGQLLFVMGNFEKDFRTHHIHVVEWNSTAWQNYINFRDYLNTYSEKAKAYDSLKCSLAEQFAENRGSYTSGKQELINQLLNEARVWRSHCEESNTPSDR